MGQQSLPGGATSMSGCINEQTWHRLTEEIMSGMRAWRAQHPKATFSRMGPESLLKRMPKRIAVRGTQHAARSSQAAVRSRQCSVGIPVSRSRNCKLELQLETVHCPLTLLHSHGMGLTSSWRRVRIATRSRRIIRRQVGSGQFTRVSLSIQSAGWARRWRAGGSRIAAWSA